MFFNTFLKETFVETSNTEIFLQNSSQFLAFNYLLLKTPS